MCSGGVSAQLQVKGNTHRSKSAGSWLVTLHPVVLSEYLSATNCEQVEPAAEILPLPQSDMALNGLPVGPLAEFGEVDK